MDNKTNKSQLMSSWKKKWDDEGLKRKVESAAGSKNKNEQLEYLSKEYDNLSHVQADKKMRAMGLSPKERKSFVEENEELSRVFGVEKGADKPLTKREKRGLLKKQEMHKKFMVRRSREATIEDRRAARKNRVANIYGKEHGSAKDYGYANVEEEGHHGVAALGGVKGSASVTGAQKGDSVIGGNNAAGLTGGRPGGISSNTRPLGL